MATISLILGVRVLLIVLYRDTSSVPLVSFECSPSAVRVGLNVYQQIKLMIHANTNFLCHKTKSYLDKKRGSEI